MQYFRFWSKRLEYAGIGTVAKRFATYLFFVLVAYAVIYFLLRLAFSSKEIFGTITLLLKMGVLYYGAEMFTDRKHKEVYYYNYNLFVLAIGFFIIGALVETLVLSNSATLMRIYSWAAMFR